MKTTKTYAYLLAATILFLGCKRADSIAILQEQRSDGKIASLAVTPPGINDQTIGYGSCVNFPNDLPANASESQVMQLADIIAGAKFKWVRTGVSYVTDADTIDTDFVMPAKLTTIINGLIASSGPTKLTGVMFTFSEKDFKAPIDNDDKIEYAKQLVDFIKQLKVLVTAKGKLNEFEFMIDVWNEPNMFNNFWFTDPLTTDMAVGGREYAKLVHEVRYYINQSTDPYVSSAFLTGASISQPETGSENWMTGAFATPNAHNPDLNGLKGLNSFSIHFYRNTVKDPDRYNIPESVISTYDTWRNLMINNGYSNKPLFSGEWGHANQNLTPNEPPFIRGDEASQARNNIRGRICLLYKEVNFHNVFGWNPLANGIHPSGGKNMPYNIFNEVGNFYTGDLLDAAKAEKTFIETFIDYSNVPEKISPADPLPANGYDLNKPVYVFKFKKPGTTGGGSTANPLIFAAWSQSNAPNQSHPLNNIPSTVLKAEVLNFINGSHIRYEPKVGNQITITNLNREPVYVKFIYN